MALKQILKLNQKFVIGLDIGSSSVKVVQLDKDQSGYSVSAAGIEHIESNRPSDNPAEDAKTQAIIKCVKNSGAKSKYTVCSVSGPEVAVRNFAFPVLEQKELDSAVMLEAHQVCPFNINEAVVDYQLINTDDKNSSGIIVAATNRVVDEKRQQVKNASLKNVLMDVEGLALINCYENTCNDDKNSTVALLNVGASRTNLAIIAANELPFTRDFHYAGNNIMEHMANQTGLSREQITRHVLNNSEDNLDYDLRVSLDAACENLVSEINKTLRYYTVPTQGKSVFVEKIFVSGGFALVGDFVQILDRHLSANVVVWNPFESMNCGDHNEFLTKNGSALALAAGLAMRAI